MFEGIKFRVKNVCVMMVKVRIMEREWGMGKNYFKCL